MTKKESKPSTIKKHQVTKTSNKGTTELQINHKAINEMATVSPYLSIIKCKCLSSPIKRQCGWIDKNTKPLCIPPTKRLTQVLRTFTGWKWSEQKGYFMRMETKSAGVALLDKTDFKSKTVTKERQCHIMIKVSILQEHIITINLYVPYVRAPKYSKQLLLIWKEK